MLPSAINRGGSELAFPSAHGFPIDSMFSFCSHDRKGESGREADAALLEVEVGGDERAGLRATLVANACLEAEVERLTGAISTGFARERIRKPPTKIRR